jgi:hypothetical protein
MGKRTFTENELQWNSLLLSDEFTLFDDGDIEIEIEGLFGPHRLYLAVEELKTMVETAERWLEAKKTKA